MGRPKASERNLRIAEAFANAITLPAYSVDMNHPSGGFRRAVLADTPFAIFGKCLPVLVRDSRDRFPVNRGGVSRAEFRKHLIRRVGYILVRCRHRKLETPGSVMLSNRRWVDYDDPADRAHLESRILELSEAFPTLVGRLDTVHIARTIAALVGNDGKVDGLVADSKLECEMSEDESADPYKIDEPEADILGKAHSPETALLTSNRSMLCSARLAVNIAPCAPLATRCYIRLSLSTSARAPRQSWSCCPTGSPKWAAFVANMYYQLGMKVCIYYL